jgi:hypothetical protein
MPALRGFARSAAALAAVLAISVCTASPAAAMIVEPDVPPGSERAAVTALPALVRVVGTFSARVHNGNGAYANGGQPYTATFTCSGFGVHPDGYIATAGHCVDANDRTLRELLVRTVAEDVVAASADPAVTLEGVIGHGMSAWVIEGMSPGAPIASEIRVTGIQGAPPDGMLARVVDDRPTGEGDVGLLKVDTTDLPTLELAAGSGPAVGTRFFTAGYAESVGDDITPGATATFQQSTVDGAGTDGGRPVYRLDGELDGGVRGGPAVDDSGRVLGINTVRTTGSYVIPVSGFADLLARNGVRAELGPRDVRYREAVDAHYRGEYTDAIEAIDRLQEEGPTHPRVAELRTEAENARRLHGDASENRLHRIVLWGSIGAGAVVVVVIGAVLVARGRRARLVAAYAGPYGGPPRPGGPFPAPGWRPGPPPGPPHRPPAAPRRPVPAPAPQAAYFDGPTRQVAPRAPAAPPSGSESPTRAITAPARPPVVE